MHHPTPHLLRSLSLHTLRTTRLPRRICSHLHIAPQRTHIIPFKHLRILPLSPHHARQFYLVTLGPPLPAPVHRKWPPLPAPVHRK